MPVAWDGDRITGCLPLVRAGRNLRSMANWETPLFGPVAVGEEHASAVVRAALARSGRTLVLDAIAEGGEGELAVAQAARATGHPLHARHWQTSPVIETAGELDDYVERTRPSWLKRLRRYRRKMEREMGLELTVAELPSDPGSVFEECLRLEAAGWKGEAGTAILSSPAMAAFYREVLAMLAASGELRLSTLRLDGRLAAFDFGFLFGDGIFSMKTAYDESLKKVVPGLVLRLSIVEHCFEDGLAANELLGGDLPWKRNFATSMREHVTIRCYPASAAGRAAHFADARARPVLRRVRGAARRGAERLRRQADSAGGDADASTLA
jgi:CelD/BcsL family acetyltransferase involved in cellulose biosynthesis